MFRVRALLTLLVLVLVPMARGAQAQPVDPYKQPRPAPGAAPALVPRAPAPPAPVPVTPGPAAPAPAADAPQDPYTPAPAAPPPGDPVLAERIAQSLVARAQELLEA